jgi:hypothetical protein
MSLGWTCHDVSEEDVVRYTPQAEEAQAECVECKKPFVPEDATAKACTPCLDAIERMFDEGEEANDGSVTIASPPSGGYPLTSPLRLQAEEAQADTIAEVAEEPTTMCAGGCGQVLTADCEALCLACERREELGGCPECGGSLEGMAGVDDLLCFACGEVVPASPSDPIPSPVLSLIVSFFLIDRAWGGAEEGGWWYDFGDPCSEPELVGMVRSFTGCDHKKVWRDAIAYRDLLSTVEDTWNEGRYELSSVCCSGVYQARCTEGLPQAFPQEAQVYE